MYKEDRFSQEVLRFRVRGTDLFRGREFFSGKNPLGIRCMLTSQFQKFVRNHKEVNIPSGTISVSQMSAFPVQSGREIAHTLRGNFLYDFAEAIKRVHKKGLPFKRLIMPIADQEGRRWLVSAVRDGSGVWRVGLYALSGNWTVVYGVSHSRRLAF